MNTHRCFQQGISSQGPALRGFRNLREGIPKHIPRFIVLIIMVLLIAGCRVHNIRPEAETLNFQKTFTVMTFNIRYGCVWEERGHTGISVEDCRKKLEAVVAAIRSIDPDVIGLQEVRNDQVEGIARALNMNYTYRTHNTFGYASDWGSAVLSKFRILESIKTEVGGVAGNRSIVTAITLTNDKPVAFISVHTDHRLSDERSINRILHHVDSISVPTVLIGDFNMNPLSPRVSLITQGAGFTDSAIEQEKLGQKMGTYGSPQAERIDYVFVQSKYFKVLEAALVAKEHHRASDHLAYYTKIKWKE